MTSMDDPHVVKYQDELLWPEPEDFADWSVAPEHATPPITADGPCPHCGHNVTIRLNYQRLGTGQAGETPPPPEERFTVLMTCDSCGRKWLATVTLSPSTPGPRIQPVVDERLRPAAVAWDMFVNEQEPRFRTLADKWTGAITALLGLFGLAVFVTSKDAFTGLPFWVKVIAAIAIILSLGCGVRAVYLSYRAAYGWPEFIERGNDQALLDWYEGRRERLKGNAIDMKAAVRLAIGALGFLVLAAGLMWLVPRADHPVVCQITRH